MTKASKAGVKHYASGNTHVPETSQEELNRGVGGPPLHMKFSRDAALSRIPAPHLLKQEQLQLAGASFRDKRVPNVHTSFCQAMLGRIKTLMVRNHYAELRTSTF